MKIQRAIYEGERIPFGWGYVRYDFPRDARLFAPMPINWIVRWGLKLWMTALDISFKPLTAMELTNHERVQYEVQRQLKTHGTKRYTAGYEYGFNAGWQAFAKHALEQLDKKAEDDIEIESCPECHGIIEHVIGCRHMDVPQ